MKKINMNDFVIDDIFKKLDKKAKKKTKESLKTKDDKNNSECYTIEINA